MSEATDTKREPQQAAGGLDPDPPNPGAWLRAWPPHIVLAVELAATFFLARHDALLLATAASLSVSAWAAWLLARRDARHRPVAIALGAWAPLMIVRLVLNATVIAEPRPYFGWARAAFHIEEASRVATALVPAWLALSVLLPPRDPRWCWRFAPRILLFVVALCLGILCVLGYPALRGEALRRVYLAAELVSLLVACGAVAAWVLRGAWRPLWWSWSPAVRVTLAIVVGDLVLLGVGAWPRGLFGGAYRVQQAGLVVMWGGVLAVQAWALWRERRRA